MAGPLSVLRGNVSESMISLAATIVAYHTKSRGEDLSNINYWAKNQTEPKTVSVTPATKEYIESIRL